MNSSRRRFLTQAAFGVGAAPLAFPAIQTGSARETALQKKIVSSFSTLQGDKAIKILAPSVGGKPEFSVEFNAGRRLFVGSVIKTFILAEALRQVDSPDVVAAIQKPQLVLDESVWSLVSPVLNPPNLTGKISERTALEAMIMHSDNTATDMALKHVGPDNVRKLIAAAGLKNTQIPDSTRIFIGYSAGVKDYMATTWKQVNAINDLSKGHCPLNDVQTMASSADDLVFYYSRALHGAFFKHRETLNEYRRILSMGDAIWLVPLPLGVSGFVKGGSIDWPGFNALSVAGGMLFSNRWVYFASTINWYKQTDANVTKDFAGALSEALAEVKDLLSA